MATMATNLQKLENALINADKAGDTVAAKQLANEIKMLQQQEQADLAKLEESIERLPKAPRPSALDIAKDVVVSPIKGAVLGSAGLAGDYLEIAARPDHRDRYCPWRFTDFECIHAVAIGLLRCG